MTVYGRNLHRIAEAEVIKLVKFRRHAANGIALIHTEYNRPSAFEQHRRHIGIRSDKACADIRHQNNYVRRVDGKLRLHPHLRKDNIFGIRLDPAGIHHGELTVLPFTFPINSVPGHARGIVHYRKALSNQFIKQGGFADIRPANNRHYWF